MTSSFSQHNDIIYGGTDTVSATRLVGDSPGGRLPLTGDMLLNEPSGNLFGLTQNVGMGWDPAHGYPKVKSPFRRGKIRRSGGNKRKGVMDAR